MKFISYKILMLDNYNKRYHIISNGYLLKHDAEIWIKQYDPNNNNSFKIISEQFNTIDFDNKSRLVLENKLKQL